VLPELLFKMQAHLMRRKKSQVTRGDFNEHSGMLIIENREPQQTVFGVNPAPPHGTNRHLMLQENVEDFILKSFQAAFLVCKQISLPYPGNVSALCHGPPSVSARYSKLSATVAVRVESTTGAAALGSGALLWPAAFAVPVSQSIP